MLADRLVEVDAVDSVSDVAVRRILKKRARALVEAAVGHPAEG
jgi:hypothetical protein